MANSIVQLTGREYRALRRSKKKRILLKNRPDLHHLPRGHEIGLEYWEGPVFHSYFFASIVRHTHIGVEVEIDS